MSKKSDLKPGTKTPASGQHNANTPRAKATGHEVTSAQGNLLPPDPKTWADVYFERSDGV